MALTQKQVSELYVAIFNRASEGEGNKYWQQQSADAKAAANNMLATPDAKAYFGTSLDSNQAFIEHIYLNTLNKTYAQDKAGVDYWVSLLNAGTSRGEVVASLVAAVADYASSTDPVTKAAYDQFNNRVDVSNYMAITVEKAPANYATSTKFATSGTTGLVVTNSASTVNNAKTTVDTMSPTGKTFSLTTGVDNILGTAGNDTVTGTLGTLNDGDRVTDNSTTDSDIFNGELIGNLTNTFHVKNIETVNLDILTGTSSIDATNWTGIKTISNKGAGSLTLTSVGSLDTAIKLDGTASNANIGFLASVVSGSSDLATVKLAKTTNGTLTMDNGVETLKLVTTAGEANTLNNLVTGVVGSKTVQITGGGEIKIAGTATAILATTTTVDARDTAKATLNHTNGANVSILTGAGNDTVKLNTILLANNLISMGAGEDTLVLNGVANLAGVLRGVENITLKTAASTIDMTNADQKAALTFEGGGLISATKLAAGSTVTSTTAAAGAVTVEFRDSVMGEKTTIDLQKGGLADTLTLTNIKDATVNYGAAAVGAIALDATAGGTEVTTDLTVNAKGALSALALTPANAGELKNLTLNATAGTITATAAISGVNKLDTLVVNATKGVTLAGITSTNTAAMTKIELNATGGDITDGAGSIQNAGSIKDVVISGTKDVTVDFVSTAANIDKLVSTTTGNTTITITNAGAANEAGSTVTLGNAADGKANSLTFQSVVAQNNTVTGGTGKDTIVTVGGDDTINAGAGDDTITGGAGADKLTGGAGNDNFIFASFAHTKNSLFDVNNTSAANIDSITDFVGNGVNTGDKITLTATGFLGTNASNAASLTTTFVSKTVASANSFAEISAALNGLVGADKIVASDATVGAGVNSLAAITVSGGSMAGKYLIVNDASNADIDFTKDAIINITGITGTLDATDILFV